MKVEIIGLKTFWRSRLSLNLMSSALNWMILLSFVICKLKIAKKNKIHKHVSSGIVRNHLKLWLNRASKFKWSICILLSFIIGVFFPFFGYPSLFQSHTKVKILFTVIKSDVSYSWREVPLLPHLCKQLNVVTHLIEEGQAINHSVSVRSEGRLS